MKKIDFKSLAILETAILASIGFFSLDFLPGNFSEFNRICSQTWSTDAKQFRICMEPYFRQTATDRYAIGVAVAALILVPLFFFLRPGRKSTKRG